MPGGSTEDWAGGFQRLLAPEWPVNLGIVIGLKTMRGCSLVVKP
jgi:hypothetical protein